MTRRGRPPHPDVLTPREWEVLALLREHLTDEQIAERLDITIHGAKYHVREILSKLGVASRQDAAAWQPEASTPARRWLALPVALRVASVLGMVAAASGRGLPAWGVAETNSTGDVLSPDPVGSPARRFICPRTPSVRRLPMWEPTGDYEDAHSDIGLTVLELSVRPGWISVFYALTHTQPGFSARPEGMRLTDDQGREYVIFSNSILEPALGVTPGLIVADRATDSGQTLTLTVDNVSLNTGQGTSRKEGSWSVTFARNADSNHGPWYTEGLLIAPESSSTYGARLIVVPDGSHHALRISWGGLHEVSVHWD